jgi:hypothetical protein
MIVAGGREPVWGQHDGRLQTHAQPGQVSFCLNFIIRSFIVRTFLYRELVGYLNPAIREG